ncbi:MAG: MerR family transcriptional regulator [Lachnospiraceae bacterium]|nr:MerR family transcriptional regulator [Lachnospiraceae bacterium]
MRLVFDDEMTLAKQRAEYSLSVGQFAKLCGTTRDTLRHYYEQSVLTPWTDPTNGYHYYSTSQISSFYFITTMQHAGCSLADIRAVIHNPSKTGLVRMINARILDMQRELYSITKKISALHLGTWLLEHFGTHRPGTPFLATIPDMSYRETRIINKDNSFHAADIARDISAHLTRATTDGHLATFPSGVTIDYEDFQRGKYVYNRVVTLSLLPADGTETHSLPGGRAILCSHDHSEPDIDRTYRRIAHYIKRNRLKACSDLFSISLINLYEGNSEHKYYKYLLLRVE